MKLDDQEEKIMQKAYSVGVASERFHRYVVLQDQDSKNFTEKEAERRFGVLRAYIKELKNYCINCGSDT